MPFTLQNLPFDKKALEPYISEKTLDFHHGKHHQAYVNKLNELTVNSKFETMSLEDIIKYTVVNTPIYNNAAQVWNHDFLWKSMKPNGGVLPLGTLKEQIIKDFGDFDSFLKEFKNFGITQFGSGWVWLVYNKKDSCLNLIKTPNAETPMINNDYIVLITVDVWEHAYYLDYQNLRPKYLDVFFDKLINWEFAQSNFNLL